MNTAVHPDVELIEVFFARLSQHGISFAVLRNVDEIAAGEAHDVDMTVDATRLAEAAVCLQQAAQERGWKLHGRSGCLSDSIHTKSFHYCLIGDDGEPPVMLHLDFCLSLPWGGHVLIPNAKMIADIDRENYRYPHVNPAVEAIYGIFNRLLYTGRIKDRYKQRVQELFGQHIAAIENLLGSFLSAENVKRLMTDVAAGDWSAVERLRPDFIRDVRRMAPSCKMWLYLHMLEKAWRRPGCVVAIEGTDGSGKSTIIEHLPQVLQRSFSADMVDYYHWRPQFICGEKKANDRPVVITEPHKKRPHGRLISLIKLAVCVVDYVLGYCLRVRWQAARGRMVVFDRYYYDFYLDPLRYRMSVGKGWLRFMQLFVPSPDVTLVLTGAAEPIWQRKKELSLSEVQQQIARLRTCRNFFANPVDIDVVRPIPQVVNNAAAAILRSQVSRFSGR